MPVPPDRRVWQEAKALKAAGYSVSVICPKGLGFTRSHEVVDGIQIYRHRTWESVGLVDHFLEYGWALVAEFFLALKIYFQEGFDILHACNPPDSIFVIAFLFKVFNVRFVFDQHDLTPELCEVRFGRKGLIYWLCCQAERLTFRTADVAISTNESCRQIALTRGRFSPERNFIVRGCPDLDDHRSHQPQPALRQGFQHLVLYVGVMGPQDGCDLLLKSINYLVNQAGRRDTLFALIGPGSEVPRLKAFVSTCSLNSA